MAGAVEYDTLTIKINADSTSANKGINRLSTNLERLDDTTKKLDTERLLQVQELLQNIASIDFSNVIEGLRDIVSAFKAFSSKSFMKATSGGTDLTPLKPEEPKGEFDLGYDFDFSALKGMGTDFDTVFSSIKDSIDLTSVSFERFTSTITVAKKSIWEIAKSFIHLENGSIRASNGLSKTMNMLVRIGKYRIIRKVIQEIYKAITEGLHRVAQFDDETNNALSSIKSSFEYLKSSLGSVLAPLIKAITPLLTMVIDLIADTMNALGALFSMIRGDKTFVQATKTVEDYANALNKTKTIGLDELNIIGEQEKTYYVKIEIENQKQLDEVYDNLEKVEAIAAAITLIMLVDWKGAIAAVGKAIVALIPQLGALTISWKGLGVAIAGAVLYITSFADMMQNKINWRNLVAGIGGLTVAMLGLQLAFHKLSITMAGGVIGGLLMIIAAIKDIIENGVNAENVLTAVIGGLTMAVSGFFLMLNTGVGSAIIAINGLRTSLIACGIAMGTLTAGAMLFITLFNQVKGSWGRMDFWQKLASVIGLVLVAVGTLVATVSAFLQQWHIFAIAVAGVAVGTAVAVGAYKSTPAFANGGFPEDGLFFANHNELVGTFSNGKTAVANNEEITTGIYEAVRDAMRDSAQNGGIRIEMDGYDVARVITKRQDNMDSFIKGGNLVYGK